MPRELVALTGLGVVAMLRGEWDEAERLTRAVLDRAEAAGHRERALALLKE